MEAIGLDVKTKRGQGYEIVNCTWERGFWLLFKGLDESIFHLLFFSVAYALMSLQGRDQSLPVYKRTLS